MGQEQELVMIPAILVVAFAAFSIQEIRAKYIAVFVICCQLITHIAMTIRPFKCNPIKGRTCNVFAFIAGILSLMVYSKVVIINKQKSLALYFAIVL